jgi:hypothetical protein
MEWHVRQILTPEREAIIDHCYVRALNDWMNSPDRSKLSRWQRTRANNLFEYLTNHLVVEFESDSGAKFIWATETFKLILDNELIIRFKKANRNGVGSNIGTNAELNFCDPQMEIPGWPEVQKVEVDYKLNVTGTAISEINVVARDGEKALWSYLINPSGGAPILPITPPQPSTPTVDDMVRPRKQDKDEKGKKDNSQKGK